ncbi:3-oxoacyl-[acyl-carrier-protein] synthase III C-terminal domain-containing protein [Mycobacterium marinum]|uniref:3-oxoacyl-ACP synthase III family protein n=1 Tax=Mycobacterium marinum TaxID=1781 RepID=UPI000B975B7B|nr:3-oxoacyl-[acyl-carrier-protein] synthase III C-terminal domain-containing protein [Mycobacterium marinum]MDC8982418.1 3-oxoacyl-[acyl-carrier-protein] synthase III C-terminal domain-containing protein [Mycobacterium marinum]MDC9001652.1 3-oxoacyl-[acyl-carrier-protein] synthase III C-terminal domain-containing protein [Mycobacterium marinum]MDC9012217.1 3-oxoacyl-[acyl-carrier-protein] synthase III C-terminal domain-containing protein [Mycobacterium marinum]
MTRHWLVMETPNGPHAPYVTRIAGAGRHLPETHLTTDDLMSSTRHRTHIDLERLTGIRERRVSVGDEDSYSLATAAALDALAAARLDPASLDVVINCSITKFRGGLTQWLEPSMSSAVARGIGAHRAMTFDVSNACAGMLTGVTILNNWIRQGVVERGLVVSGEYISQLSHNAARHIRNIMSKELASLTLGDAGAALLLERAPVGSAGIALAGFTTVADYSRLCLAYPRGHDPGARMFTNARAIHQAAMANTPLLLEEVLETAGISIHDIDHVITHQTSARAIRKGMAKMSEAFGDKPRHDAVITVDRYGNTASTTHTVALIEELTAGRIVAGERIALIALASGLEIGIVLLTLDEEMVSRYGHSD